MQLSDKEKTNMEPFTAQPVRGVLQGQEVDIYMMRRTLTLAQWMQLPLPKIGVVKWTLRHETAGTTLDVSYEETIDVGAPNFFSLTALGSIRDSVSETWVPPKLWVRRNAANQVYYFEIVMPRGVGGDAIMDLLGANIDGE